MNEPPAEPGPSFLDPLGERGHRRAEPRMSVALAGAGCALGVLGVLVLAGDTGLDDDTGEFTQLPGILLSALVIALGYFVLSSVRGGPFATAGTVAAALGVPAFTFFVTFDDEGFPPYETEAILVVSTAVWLATYLVGPARGRPFFLGAGLLSLWFTVLELTEDVFDSPFTFFGSFFGGTIAGEGSFESDGIVDPVTGEVVGGFVGPTFDPPDPATIGMLSLLFGAAFLASARWLDRRGRHGTAAPFTFAAVPCLAVGVVGLADDLEAAGSGVLLAAIGLVLAWSGSTTRRRGTTWIGGGATAAGLALFLGDMAGDSASTGGLLFIAGGIAMIFGGHLVQTALDERDEMEPTGVPAVATAPAPRVHVSDPKPPDDPDAEWRPPVPPPAEDDGPPPPAEDDGPPPPA